MRYAIIVSGCLLPTLACAGSLNGLTVSTGPSGFSVSGAVGGVRVVRAGSSFRGGGIVVDWPGELCDDGGRCVRDEPRRGRVGRVRHRNE
jgi:hypothetical protein